MGVLPSKEQLLKASKANNQAKQSWEVESRMAKIAEFKRKFKKEVIKARPKVKALVEDGIRTALRDGEDRAYILFGVPPSDYYFVRTYSACRWLEAAGNLCSKKVEQDLLEMPDPHWIFLVLWLEIELKALWVAGENIVKAFNKQADGPRAEFKTGSFQGCDYCIVIDWSTTTEPKT